LVARDHIFDGSCEQVTVVGEASCEWWAIVKTEDVFFASFRTFQEIALAPAAVMDTSFKYVFFFPIFLYVALQFGERLPGVYRGEWHNGSVHKVSLYAEPNRRGSFFLTLEAKKLTIGR
jgi:hypothetical protein